MRTSTPRTVNNAYRSYTKRTERLFLFSSDDLSRGLAQGSQRNHSWAAVTHASSYNQDAAPGRGACPTDLLAVGFWFAEMKEK
jgi:hypothetical protein